MHRNTTADSFPVRIRNAYYKVLDTVMERYHALRKSDWSLIAGSQKLLAYSDGQCVDGIPIDWFVCGCLEPREAPVDYRGDRWDVLKKNRLYPIIDTINKKIDSDFRTKLVLSGARSNYTTIYLVAEDLSKVHLSVTTNLYDSRIAKWTAPVRKRSRSPVRGRDRKRSRSPPVKSIELKVKEPSPKRLRADPPNVSTDVLAESARVLAELTAITKAIALYRAQIDDANDVKNRTEQFLASLGNGDSSSDN